MCSEAEPLIYIVRIQGETAPADPISKTLDRDRIFTKSGEE